VRACVEGFPNELGEEPFVPSLIPILTARMKIAQQASP